MLPTIISDVYIKECTLRVSDLKSGVLMAVLAMALLWMPLSGGAVESSKKENKAMKVLLKTSEGDVVILLSELTPGHRDNFVKNVEAGAYDGVLFHRVIKDFMVQTGDPTSKTSTPDAVLGANDYGEEIPGEFVLPELFHKRGAVAAARTGDAVNPEKKSSGSQFYIVTGKVYNESELVAMEKSLQNQQKQSVFQALAKEAGAVYKIDGMALVNCKVFEKFLETFREF